jgi:NADH:ubiquinone oxidoreductase subunit E
MTKVKLTKKEKREKKARLAVLSAVVGFEKQLPPKTIDQIVSETGLPKAQVYRIVTTHDKILATRVGRRKAYYTNMVSMSLL